MEKTADSFLTKNKIIHEINKSLGNKIESIYIIGSFLNDDWNQQFSDIDLVCVDSSFEYFPYLVNQKYIKNNLSYLFFRFDINIFTHEQFYKEMNINLKFNKEINKGIRLW
jgi:hypothetical protein